MPRRRRVLLLGAAAAAVATLVTAGCASGGSGKTLAGPSGSTVPTPGLTTGTTPTIARTPRPTGTVARPRSLSVSFADNGTSLRLRVGQRLHVVLATPYWTFHPSDTSRVLRQDANGVGAPSATCSGPPGTAGCGTRTADFTAIGAGRTVVVATRVICGEAMRCTGSNGRFAVYVTVGG